jgi:hypothetical protein
MGLSAKATPLTHNRKTAIGVKFFVFIITSSIVLVSEDSFKDQNIIGQIVGRLFYN